MRITVLFAFLTLTASQALAQTDSLNFKNKHWSRTRIAPGIILKQVWFKDKSLFGSNQFISVLEIKQRKRNRFYLGFETIQKKTTSEFAIENQAIAAINGTFFDVKNGGSVDFIRAKGQVINENRTEKDNVRARHQKAAIVIKDGRLHIEEWDGSSDWEKNLNGEDVMLTGPLLMVGNRHIKLDTAGFNILRHPRSAIAITDNSHILMIAIDGRSANSAGVNLQELQHILSWLHCSDGINLDGGGSTTLWNRRNGVVNHPSDGGKWNHENQRKVANAILLNRNNEK